jgi:hypothetical protein
MAVEQPEPWLQALITNNINNGFNIKTVAQSDKKIDKK